MATPQQRPPLYNGHFPKVSIIEGYTLHLLHTCIKSTCWYRLTHGFHLGSRECGGESVSSCLPFLPLTTKQIVGSWRISANVRCELCARIHMFKILWDLQYCSLLVCPEKSQIPSPRCASISPHPWQLWRAWIQNNIWEKLIDSRSTCYFLPNYRTIIPLWWSSETLHTPTRNEQS